MTVGNWTSVIGTAIEIGGFAYLSKELLNANTSAIVENDALRQEKNTATSLSVCDGEDGGIVIEGGLIGKLIENINERQQELTKSKILIRRGLGWTGLGIAVQLVGSVGQAIGW
jgi:hypothetical protein